jgi:hypothetical protein
MAGAILFCGVLSAVPPLAGGSLEQVRYVATGAYVDAYASYVADGMPHENVRPRRALLQQYAGFQRDLDLCTLEELAADPIYIKYLHPRGIGWTGETTVAVPTSDVLVFDLCRAREAGPFSQGSLVRLNSYRPHLARSAMVSARLGLERAKAPVDALSAMGLPAAAVSAKGRVRAANGRSKRWHPQLGIARSTE